MATQREFLIKMAEDGTANWMDEQIQTLKDGIRSMEQRKAQFLDASIADANVTKVNVLSWFINDIANIQRNMRLDLAVNHSSALVLSRVEQ